MGNLTNLSDVPLKIGLALGGGGARGLAHIGVLKVLQSDHFPFHCIVGSSMGAIVGGLFSRFGSAQAVEEKVVRFFESPLFKHIGLQAFAKTENESPHDRLDHVLTNLKLRLSFMRVFRQPSLLSEGEVQEMFTSQMDDTPLETLPLRFGAVATDLLSGREIVLWQGSFLRALQASSAIPGIFPPVKHNGYLLIDGGASDSIPVEVVDHLGADLVIGINVTKCIRQRPKLTNALRILYRADEIATWHLTQERLRAADFVIKPRVNRISWANFKRYRDIIRRGEEAAREALPHLWTLLEKKTLDKQNGILDRVVD